MTLKRRFMSARTIQIIALLIILASLLVGRQAAAFHEDTLLVEMERGAPTADVRVETDGSTVVWNEEHEDQQTFERHSAIAAAHLDTNRQRFVIASTTPAYGSPELVLVSPDVDGDIVIWIERSIVTLANGNTEWHDQIVGKRFSGATPFVVATAQPGTHFDRPHVDGEWFIWTEVAGSDVRIVADNWTDDAAPIVVAEGTIDARTGERSLGTTIVDDGWLVWGEDWFDDTTVPGSNPDRSLYHGYARLMGLELGAGEPVVLFDSTEMAVPPTGYDFNDGVVVLRGAHTGIAGYDETATQQIHVIDETGQRDITFQYGTPFAGGGSVTTDGRYVFWNYQIFLSGSTCCTYQTLAYDLETGSTFPVLDSSGSGVSGEDGFLMWVTGTYVSSYIGIHATPLADRLPTAPHCEPDVTIPEITYVPETGHYLGWGFRDYWEDRGGLAVFGHPLTEEFREQNPDTGRPYTVQYFERQRFEWHLENVGTPYDVLLGRLGAQLLEQQGRDWTTFPKADPAAPHYVPETGHAIAPEFYGYWSSHGLEFGDADVSYRESVALFGYPLSEPMMETNADGDTVLTQYFERAVFEHHPDNPAGYQVLLRRVGAELVAARGW